SLVNPARLSNIGRKASALLPVVRDLLVADPIANPERHELGVTAKGLADAAEILGATFHLIATNVPYLGRGRQDQTLQDYCELVHPHAKSDLATCFVERCLELCSGHGTAALVTPQSWLFQDRYSDLRKRLLSCAEWNIVAQLGARAFETISGERVNVALLGLSRCDPCSNYEVFGLDVSAARTPAMKDFALRDQEPTTTLQSKLLLNPDARIVLEEISGRELLCSFANSWQG